MPAQILLGGDDITALAPQDRVRRGLARTFQINTLFPGLNALEAVTLAVCERARRRRAVLAQHRGAIARRSTRPTTSWRRCSSATTATGRRANCPMAASACWRSRSRSRPSRRCCCSTSRRPACRRTRAASIFEVIASLSRRHHGAVHRARHGPRVPLRHAHHRAGRRRASCSKARRRRSPPIRACARSIWASAAWMPIMAEPLLTLHDVRAGYGDAVVLRRRLARGAGARQPRGARPQRRRQVDAAAHHHGLHASCARQRCAGAAPTCRALPPHRRARQRHRLGGAGARDLSLADASRKTSRSRARPGRWDAATRLRAVSAPCTSAAATWATSCPAASSRCWRSRAR